MKISDPALIDLAYGTIANIETIAHSNELFCMLRNRALSPHFTVADNTCFDFSGTLEPKSGLLLNFSEHDGHYFNGTFSNSKNNQLAITVSKPGRESNFSFQSPYHALFIDVTESHFKALFEQLTHLDYEQFFANDYVHFITEAAKANTAARIRNILKSDFEDPTFLEDLIMNIDPTPVSNQRSFCNTLALHTHSLLMANKTRPVTITELTKTLNAPARSIQQGFKNVYGQGPIAFHNDYRMQCVRKFLKSNKVAHGDLTAIIYHYGFSHQGRFAQRYRMLYGVSPSKEK